MIDKKLMSFADTTVLCVYVSSYVCSVCYFIKILSACLSAVTVSVLQ